MSANAYPKSVLLKYIWAVGKLELMNYPRH